MTERMELAKQFAMKAHEGQKRKMTGEPVFNHLEEVAGILETLTDSEDTVIAGLLHDTLEDTKTTEEEIEGLFGNNVLRIVKGETEDTTNKDKSSENWILRKRKSLEGLSAVEDAEIKKLWLADKVSNMRSFRSQYDKEGIAFTDHLNQKNPAYHSWYYREVLKYIDEFAGTTAYEEFKENVEYIFGDIEPWEDKGNG